MTEIYYPLTALGVLAVVAVYIVSVMAVGRARGTYKVEAPATTGHPDFERRFRAQQNNVEQLVAFLPLVVITAHLFGDLWGAIYAFLFAIGRWLFARGYGREASKRSLGFMISGIATLLALVACVVGVIVQLVA